MYRLVKSIINNLLRFYSSRQSDWNDKLVSEINLPQAILSYQLPVNFSRLPASLQRSFVKVVNPPPGHVYTLQDVFLSGHGTVFKNLRLFTPSLHPGTEKNFQNSFLLRQVRAQKLKLPEAGKVVAVAHDQWSTQNYFHWVIESLPRLLLLRELAPNCILIVPSPTPEFILSTAQALGFTQLLPLSTGEVVKVPQLLVPRALPSNLSDFPTYQEEQYVQQMRVAMLNAFCPPLQIKQRKRRVYASRANASLRVVANEAELLKVLSEYGFETVLFEEMTFQEQVSMMHDTDILLGVHGANLTNLVFMLPGTTIIEIAAPELLNNVYYRLALYSSLEYYYLVCDPETLDMVRMTGRVDLERLRALLDDIITEPISTACVL
ncbi:DUF563 domain-containing protein [Hymenobacter sp. BT730]|uniref:glycosyltransferase family 61 protein n=1 Tax=Hymenobacter sp. BT730 TaxID=3063332 RepID=UPI0026E0D218|nr:glycosyltransferase family 61 protein [Hymenobacter sp. BT730]